MTQLLPVNEIFHSIQGEGSYTGTPSVFVRLQSCPVGCPWCDTKHTWEKKDTDKISFTEMYEKKSDSPKWAEASADYLSQFLFTAVEEHIVITGGEPCLYDLSNLTAALTKSGKSVQIETSGTSDIRVNANTFVTLSPKIDMPGGLKVLMSALYHADEIKMPIGKMRDVETLKGLLASLAEYTDDIPLVYLQPLSQSEKATELCIQQAAANNWRLSAQLHKYLKVR
jgi:7-carboxy-7-deazaguanine synthase